MPSKQDVTAGKYQVIYADPPWRYDFSETSTRKIENQYPTMKIEDICNLDIPSADNSVLFLWATAPKLREALQVMEAWAFEYKTHGIWDKGSVGMGYWLRGQHELLLVGVKGNFSPPEATLRVSSVYRENKQRHSAKPQHFRDIIDRYFPDAAKLEVFARHKAPGWEVWGNEAPTENTPTKTRLFDVFYEALTRRLSDD